MTVAAAGRRFVVSAAVLTLAVVTFAAAPVAIGPAPIATSRQQRPAL